MKIIASALPLGLILAAIAVLAVTGNLISASPFVIAAQVAAIGLNIWARASFQRGTFRVGAAPGASTIIRRGPYRFIRHPMYAAVLIFIGAAVAGHPNPLALAIGLAATAIAVMRVIVEEKLLRGKYPDYPDYARATKALIPFIV
jgi:protein-S-isoprenylcysteine O-methyltransferase Ste14